MGYYNDLTLGDSYTSDDEWYDRKDYGRIVIPAPAPTPAPAVTILPHVESDLAIPPVATIQARIADLRADAEHQRDQATIRQLDNLRDALDGGMRMVWVLGDLLVSSASTPGTVYTVSCGACNCPARKPCKHLKLAEVLLDLLDVEAGDADMEADADDPELPIWSIGQALGDRLASARRGYVLAL